MNLSTHFTTALSKPAARQRIAAILFGACVFSAHAETKVTELSHSMTCAEVFQLQSSIVQVHGGGDAYDSWWFEPHEFNQYQAGDHAARSLPLVPADAERFLGAKNDSVLIRWRSSVSEASQLTRLAQRELYLLVRAGDPINDMNGKTLGRFVRLIAKARWDDRLSLESSGDNSLSREFIAPLRITQAVEEVGRGDQVVPRMCVQLTVPQASAPTMLSASSTPSTQARVLGFLPTSNARLIGAHNSIAIMDQGAEHGVTPEQRWALVEMIDTAQKNTQVTRQRAQVRIVQVLPRYSILQIQNAEREVVRGAHLKRLTPAVVGAP